MTDSDRMSPGMVLQFVIRAHHGRWAHSTKQDFREKMIRFKKNYDVTPIVWDCV